MFKTKDRLEKLENRTNAIEFRYKTLQLEYDTFRMDMKKLITNLASSLVDVEILEAK